MLPIVSGVKITKINILVYSIILFLISLLPYYLNYSGITYFVSSLILGIYYIYLCLKLLLNDDKAKNQIISIRIFVYSIFYLFLIFSIILLDKLI
jgi:Polyprenyltransferase (cytochrome oxidase assembly factor)